MSFQAEFVRDISYENTPWDAVIVPKRQIDLEIERLADEAPDKNGRRRRIIKHPLAASGNPSLAPGIQVALEVLKPGEATEPFRHNATEVNFCLDGTGYTRIRDRKIGFEQYDIWNHPSFTAYRHVNEGSELQVRFVYSNEPLLKYLQVYLSESNISESSGAKAETVAGEQNESRSSVELPTIECGAHGSLLMPYEKLINPQLVQSEPNHWAWPDVRAELERLESLGQSYVGRRLYLLYNKMTGRTNGTTPSFFATMTIRPAGIVDRPHRHVSAAINYYFRGHGRSTVNGAKYEWGPGDLMLSAPGWATHNHASYDERVFELTIQDQPFHLWNESLLWQEDMKEPPALLGVESGFETNRNTVVTE